MSYSVYDADVNINTVMDCISGKTRCLRDIYDITAEIKECLLLEKADGDFETDVEEVIEKRQYFVETLMDINTNLKHYVPLLSPADSEKYTNSPEIKAAVREHAKILSAIKVLESENDAGMRELIDELRKKAKSLKDNHNIGDKFLQSDGSGKTREGALYKAKK